MFKETKEKINYFFIDFGSSHKIGSNLHCIETFTPNISPPEQDARYDTYALEKQSEKSDIYSLSKSFFLILNSSKINLSPSLIQILEDMSHNEIEKRISINQAIERIFNLFPSFKNFENKNFSGFDFDNFFIKNFSQIFSEMNSFCEENNHTPIEDLENQENNKKSEHNYLQNLNKNQLIKKIKEIKKENEEKLSRIVEENEKLLQEKEDQIKKLLEEIEKNEKIN